jgi:hypothetical protein
VTGAMTLHRRAPEQLLLAAKSVTTGTPCGQSRHERAARRGPVARCTAAARHEHARTGRGSGGTRTALGIGACASQRRAGANQRAGAAG